MKFQSMLILQKRYCLIDSPIPFQLVCNPYGTFNSYDENRQFIGDLTDINGTDICSRPAGAWQFDIHHLLPEKWMKENPAFKVAICYDDSALSAGQSVSIGYSDVNLGEGVAGVNGQTVQDIELIEKVTELKTTVDKIQSIIESQNPSHNMELVATYNTIDDFLKANNNTLEFWNNLQYGDFFFIPEIKVFKSSTNFGLVTIKDIFLFCNPIEPYFQIVDCNFSFTQDLSLKTPKNGRYYAPYKNTGYFRIETGSSVNNQSLFDLSNFNTPQYFTPIKLYKVLD